MIEAVPMTIRDANAFVKEHHRHNNPTAGGKFAIGASSSDELVGVAIVGLPIARLNNDGVTAEVLRTCVKPNAPKGTNSFLYGCAWRAWRAMGGKRLITYTLKEESGESLRGAGFKVIGEVQASKGWSRPRIGRIREWQPVYGQQKIKWAKGEA